MKWKASTRRRVGVLAIVLGATVVWWVWAENHPGQERALRVAFREQMASWFPDGMRAPEGTFGWTIHGEKPDARLTVALVHGLDEPGDIWDDVILTLQAEPVALWELRYPNDQAIDRSGAFLAEVWSELPTDRPVVLVGHSMGGLVVREFVSAWRHPAAISSRVGGARVVAVFLIGTPNHGSEWARFRSWLELRDQFKNATERHFSLFASLRDGAGEAKVDLRPGSDFLTTLNAREWPDSVDLRLIAGNLLDDQRFRESLDRLLANTPSADSAKVLRGWWNGLGQALGDGVVTIESVRLEGVADPLVLPASHRGLVRRSVFEPDEPPAIPVLAKWIREVGEDSGPGAAR